MRFPLRLDDAAPHPQRSRRVAIEGGSLAQARSLRGARRIALWTVLGIPGDNAGTTRRPDVANLCTDLWN
ncbi:hypothetical protein ABA31_22020 [Agrococcus baldri]|uniref:Uncharacterized protein n=1 Tax=Agrococcus baldri TaxID=153730 RepID=A0AA87USE3_9MICO|nr:hypothetical protein ABA31_22020 [Agrococcus baldri]